MHLNFGFLPLFRSPRYRYHLINISRHCKISFHTAKHTEDTCDLTPWFLQGYSCNQIFVQTKEGIRTAFNEVHQVHRIKDNHQITLLSCPTRFLGLWSIGSSCWDAKTVLAEVWQLETHHLSLQCLQSSKISCFACMLSNQTWVQKLFYHSLVQNWLAWDIFGVLFAKVHVLFHGAPYLWSCGWKRGGSLGPVLHFKGVVFWTRSTQGQERSVLCAE